MKKSILIITTINDTSLPLFLTQEIRDSIDVRFCFFHEPVTSLLDALTSQSYTFIYIRDPFNAPFDANDIRKKIESILTNQGRGIMIDNITASEDIFLEDKWIQYQRFSAFMPETALLKRRDSFTPGTLLAKKRISSRAKGIIFNPEGLPSVLQNNYILQKKVSIEKEYRVYIIMGEIIPTVSLKNPHRERERCIVYGTEKISEPLLFFTKDILIKNQFDFIGLDIVMSKRKYFLLEVNRSCQFMSYFKHTGNNLAETLVKKLLKDR